MDRLSREVVEAEYRAKASASKEWEDNKTRLTGEIADLQQNVRNTVNKDNLIPLIR